ncbi:MAG TPA: hypothetical protein PLZ45_01110 [Ferruginibacter sp.]|nr:hypothetical protein [Ferruginibacter sp.]
MENNNKHDGSRRWFLSLFTSGSKKTTGANMVKMLTPDGKLVEVDRSVLDAAQKQKATNQDIFDWMENPSKEKF